MNNAETYRFRTISNEEIICDMDKTVPQNTKRAKHKFGPNLNPFVMLLKENGVLDSPVSERVEREMDSTYYARQHTILYDRRLKKILVYLYRKTATIGFIWKMNKFIYEVSTSNSLTNARRKLKCHSKPELLQLFGVPYIVAPMEAEAQCAFLNEANLTDGTITDDSDIWLFGGKIVYKNFFNQSKHVMQFCAEDIEHHFNLSRLKLIQLSLLVGSDYTVGLQGIGPVTALEILAAFPSYNENAALSYQQVISGLIRFRTWFNKGRIAGPGKTALRTKLRNLEVTENFPSANVARAYLEPKVEDSREQFSWGKPDIIALTDYAKQKFGWTQKKSEEILKPVLKRLQETKAQTTIKDYFKTKHKIDVVDLSEKMSKRVKTAVSRMGQDPTADGPEKEKKTRARKTKPRKSKKIEVDEDLVELQRVEMASTSKVKEIEEDVKKQLERNLKRTLNAKAVIHQKERDRSELAKNKMKAIESFRKSKHGPGFVKKRAKVVRRPKDDAELSENTSDDD